MDIDIGGQLKKALDEAIERARKLESSEDLEKAGVLWEKASMLMLKYAECAPRREDEFRRKKWAMQYRERAAILRSGEKPRPPAAPAAAADGDSPGPAPAPGRRPRKQKLGGKDDASEIKMAVSGLVTSSPVTWADIGGLESTKAEIKFALGVSVSKPPQGVKVQPFRNILFYGPPGTGKTLLAAATSNALTASGDRKAVFFNVKVSSVMSKYFGESSKIVSELYGTARDQSPSVVFLDEFEALAQNRDDGDNTGPERRILSTILAELDGLAEKGRADIYVLTIAATNRPWDLDAAVLSRFEKKILIPLPDHATRKVILEIHLDRRGYAVQADRGSLVAMTEGFSGREIERFCKEAATLMIMEMNREIPSLLDRGFEALRGNTLRARPLAAADFERASARVRPQTSAEDMRRYAEWSERMEEA